ncbi:MAG: hypothetical protein Kilf2KO_24020 [Rhodospirillales bacterium]
MWEDADVHVYEHFNAKTRIYLKSVINERLIEEHRKRPIGQHSEPLERLLAYFRRLPLSEQYAVKREAGDSFRIVRLSGLRGRPPKMVDEAEHRTLEAAYHAIFLRQIDELMEKK